MELEARNDPRPWPCPCPGPFLCPLNIVPLNLDEPELISKMLKGGMENRIGCERCREKFSASTNTETVTCPRCGEVNPNRIIRKPEHSGRASPPLITNSVKEKVKKILRGSSKKPAASVSPPTNYPKLCALDKSGPLAKKRAVLCGVSYKKWKYKLKGTINDALNMKDFLIKDHGFAEENILVLTEEQTDARLIPTKVNIENCLNWLVKEFHSGDSLVFYYSGHGLRQPDFNNDERDGFDETICPVDFLKEGMILDNDIYATIVKPLPVGVTLHAIVDACHSGTILDLEHVYDVEEGKWIDNKPPSGVRKQTSGGKAYSICACEDNQVAADTSAFSSKKMNGAMTFILIEEVRRKPSTTYGELLYRMHERIEQANQQRCLGGSTVVSRIFGPNFTQKPLLSASEEFDVYKRPFKL
ncbi:hypothetical protein DITRI_Ditri08aG0088800 [Diplodiscus trichospermus]